MPVTCIQELNGCSPSRPRPHAAGAQSAHDHAVNIASWAPARPRARPEQRNDRYLAALEGAPSVTRARFAVPGAVLRNVIGAYDVWFGLHILMAHTDSTPDGPGANDNALGGLLAADGWAATPRAATCGWWPPA